MDYGRILEITLKGLASIFSDAAKTLFANRRLAFLAALGIFLCSAALGYWSLMRANRYLTLVDGALDKKTEDTPQTYKALESLILVALEAGTGGHQAQFTRSIEQAYASPHLKEVISQIDQVLAQPSQAPTRRLVVLKPDISSKVHQQEAIITEDPEPDRDIGFLFLPARLIRGPLREADFGKIAAGSLPIEPQLDLVATRADPRQQVCQTKSDTKAICDDILLTRNLTPVMYDATREAIGKGSTGEVDLKPVQVYVITENGVNRIVSGKKGDSVIYRNQFNASTVFQARPYYIQALARAGEGIGRLTLVDGIQLGGDKGYFYVSEPYLDIGGNGMVITLAKAFRYPNHSEGVLCFDLKLDTDIGARLQSLVLGLDGTPADVSCTVSSERDPPADCSATSGDHAFSASVKRTLTESLNRAVGNSSKSDVVGNIIVTPQEAGAVSTAGVVGTLAGLWQSENLIEFSVPLGPPTVPAKGTVALSFFAAALRTGQYLRTTAMIGALSLFGCGIGITIIIGSWATDARLKEEQEREKIEVQALRSKEVEDLHGALRNVANVMIEADTPYVRLDSEDKIMDANPALFDFFGFPRDTGLARLQNTRFRNWLADDDSRTEYDRVQDLRRLGRRVDPYVVRFRSIQGPKAARVVSSIVPAGPTSADGLPETFGILTAPP